MERGIVDAEDKPVWFAEARTVRASALARVLGVRVDAVVQHVLERHGVTLTLDDPLIPLAAADRIIDEFEEG